MWNDIAALRTFSHILMLVTGIGGIGAVCSTSLRYYVDRRASSLSSQTADREAQKRDLVQTELRIQLEAAEKKLKDSTIKLESLKSSESRVSLRKVANIRPDGMEVNFISGSRSGSGVSSSAASAIRDSLKAVIDEIQHNNPKQARTLLDSIATQFPDWPYAYFYMG